MFLAVTAENERTRQKVLNSARSGYYDCLRAQAQLQVTVESLNLSKEHLRQAEAMYKAGMISKGDVLRATTSVSQGELDRINAENDLNVSWVVLERIAGTAISRQDILKPISGDAIDNLKPPQLFISGDVNKRALSHRAEMRAYQYYADRSNELIKSAAGRKLPNVSLSGQYKINDENSWSADADNWQLQLQLQWVLFDSGETSGQVAKARAASKELAFQMEDLKAQIRQEVEQASLKLRSAETRLDVAAGQISTAEEDYLIAVRRYNAQMGTNLDVMDAGVALAEIRAQYVNAVYDIAIAQAELIYAMGEGDIAAE
jgi:outer membrane protein TolC